VEHSFDDRSRDVESRRVRVGTAHHRAYDMPCSIRSPSLPTPESSISGVVGDLTRASLDCLRRTVLGLDRSPRSSTRLGTPTVTSPTSPSRCAPQRPHRPRTLTLPNGDRPGRLRSRDLNRDPPLVPKSRHRAVYDGVFGVLDPRRLPAEFGARTDRARARVPRPDLDGARRPVSPVLPTRTRSENRFVRRFTLDGDSRLVEQRRSFPELPTSRSAPLAVLNATSQNFRPHVRGLHKPSDRSSSTEDCFRRLVRPDLRPPHLLAFRPEDLTQRRHAPRTRVHRRLLDYRLTTGVEPHPAMQSGSTTELCPEPPAVGAPNACPPRSDRLAERVRSARPRRSYPQ